MIVRTLALLSVVLLQGCNVKDDPIWVDAVTFATKYEEVKANCKRIVIGENTVYNCQNPEDTMYIKPVHALPAGRTNGHNAYMSAEWGTVPKYGFTMQAPFQVW